MTSLQVVQNLLLSSMANKKTLLITANFHPETVAKLDQLYDTCHLWEFEPHQRAGLIANLAGRCRAAASPSWHCDPVVYRLQGLEMIAAFGVGVDGIDFVETTARGIRVTNTPDVLNDSVADLALALILTTSRNLINADNFARSGAWLSGPFPFGSSLAGKTLGIAGLGRIGLEIALRAETFKLRIAYHNRTEKPELPYTYYRSLTELAAASDILLCMLPGGDATRNVIDTQVLAALGKGGYFINVGRGSSVNEADLEQALRDKTIAGAGLDVYQDEPRIPPGIAALDNVVLLPHIGSATVETRRAMGQLVIDNLGAFFAGKPVLTEVQA